MGRVKWEGQLGICEREHLLSQARVAASEYLHALTSETSRNRRLTEERESRGTNVWKHGAVRRGLGMEPEVFWAPVNAVPRENCLLSPSAFSSVCASCQPSVRCGHVLAWLVNQPSLSQELESVSRSMGVWYFDSCRVKAVSALSRPARAVARQAKGNALTCVGWCWLVRSHRKRKTREGKFPILLATVGGIFAGWISPQSFQTDKVCEMFMKELACFQALLHRPDVSQLLPSPLLTVSSKNHHVDCAPSHSSRWPLPGRAEASW